MGEIRKVNRLTGESEVVGSINPETMTGKPHIYVYDSVHPRTTGDQELLEMTIAGSLKAYVRFDTSEECNKHLGGGKGTFVATKQNCEALGFEPEKVWAEAIENTKASGLHIRTMSETIAEMSGIPVELLPFPTEPTSCILVVRSERGDGYLGAGVMAIPCLMEEVRERIGDFYILPSSVHEIICVPTECDLPIDYTRAMVKEINQTELNAADKLSDDVFLFDETGLHVA